MKKEKATVDIEAAKGARTATVEKLLAAVDAELKAAFVPRHLVNKLSPSFPYNHRTLANRDCDGSGPTETIMIGGRMFHEKKSLLDWLRLRLLGEE